ncbi:MAG: tetratricopeptide repeat protein [Bacteroidia bacterium]
MSDRLEQLHEMLREEPDDSFLNYALALEYGKSGDIKKAIELIENVLQRDANYLGAYYQLGKYYEAVRQNENALLTYKKGAVIAQAQNNKKALGELNEALWMLEDD